MSNKPLKTYLVTLTALLIFASSVALSVRSGAANSFQFIDRIVRPCASGATPFVSAIAASDGDLDLTTCVGRSVTVNGVPLVIVPGGGLADPGSNGYVVRTALNTTVARTFGNGTAITVTNGTGVAGNTSFSLNNTAVTAGAYTNANITVDAQGRLTAAANGSSGITNSAPNNTIPLSNGTNLIDSNITWDGSAGTGGRLRLISGATGISTFEVIGLGAQLHIQAADGDAITPGGEINLLTGSSSGSSGGQLNITAGDDSAAGDGGNIVISSGTSAAAGLLGDGGAIDIRANPSANADRNGGDITIAAGGGTSGQGGNVDISPGQGATDGVLTLNNADFDISLELGDLIATLTGNLNITGELFVALGLGTGTAADTDLAGDLTIGAGGTVTYTFTQTYASAPICTASDTDAAPNIVGASATTTTLTVTGTVGHVVNYICIGRN